MAKIFGYILLLLGLALIVLKFVFENTFNSIHYLSKLNALWVIVIGAILIVAGFLSLRSKKKKEGRQISEIPIYKDGRVVGYRRD